MEYEINNFEKIKKIIAKNIIWVLIVIIFFVLLLLFWPTPNIKEEAIKKTEEFIRINRIAISSGEEVYFRFKEINYSISSRKCYEDGGISITNNNGVYDYKVYYICNNKYSDDLNLFIKEGSSINLNGPKLLFVKQGYTYEDPGYVSNNSNMIIKTSGTVYKEPGMYLIKYTAYTSGGQNYSAKRLVVVTKKEFTSTPIITLNGENPLTIKRGEHYSDSGYKAFDYKDGNLTSNVSVVGSVNPNVVGKYTLTYTVTNSSGVTTSVIRNVNVVANLSELYLKDSYTPNTLTNGNVTISLDISGEGYSFFLDPDGNVIKTNNYSYIATENGDYTFVFKKKDGSVFEKTVTISNIDKTKPTGSCNNTITINNTFITVTANDENDIKEYSYIVDGTLASTTTEKSFSLKKESSSASVIVYDKAGNSNTLVCTNDNQVKQHESIYSQNEEYGLKYLLFVPEGLYVTKKSPLVIFLHGSGECGTSVSGQFNSNTAFVNSMKAKTLKGAVFIAPICDCNYDEYKENWSKCLTRLKTLIDYLIKKYNIDEDRISITGHSLGANGVYQMINAYPDLFSVGVPLAGRLKTYSDANIALIAKTKIRAYCGTEDGVYENAKSSIDKLKNAGGDAEFVSLPNKGHIIQKAVYIETDVIEWMISQKRK